MHSTVVAALVAAVQSAVSAPAVSDLATATPIAGDWTYAATTDGSEASFANVSAVPQLWVHCTRATRRLTIAKPASGAAPFVSVWTSALTRSVASSFDPATRRLTIEFANFDPLLDGIANSRGRIAFTVDTQPPLVVPAWAEVAHVIEDCRA